MRRQKTAVLKRPDRPTHTIFVPFTRDWFITDWLRAFDRLEIPDGSEFVGYVDSDSSELFETLYRYFTDEPGNWNGITLYQSGREKLTIPSTAGRRNRITEMLNDSRRLVSKSSSYLIGIEDDTTLLPGSLIRLLGHLKNNGNVGFAEAVQMGRWNLPMIGAWQVDAVADPHWVTTKDFRVGQVDEIDGGGLYAFATYSRLWRGHDFTWKWECFGPDVDFVMGIRKKGYQAVCDMGLVAKHHLSDGSVLDPNEAVISRFKWIKNDAGSFVRGGTFAWSP